MKREISHSFCISDVNKFFDYAKKYIEYLKKLISSSSAASEQMNPYRLQIGELCRDIIEEKQLQLKQEDEKSFRLLSIEMLANLKAIPTNLNEFVRSNREKKKSVLILFFF